MKRIIQKNNPKEDKVLRKISGEVPVDKIKSEKIQELLLEMKEALKSQSDGVALAAPQISVSLRIFIISPMAYDNHDKHSGKKHFVFINPKIIKISKDKKLMEEGCLSVRPWYGKVRRSSRATVEAYDENGEKFEMEGTGLLAQIFQHETDHLDGILFTDKAKDLQEIVFEDENY